MKKLFKLKKFWILCTVLLTLIIVIDVLIISINNINVGEVTKLDRITTLTKNDSAMATELVKKNVVKIINKVNGSEIVGTGFFNEDGYLITNSHVVDIKGDIKIEYYDGTGDDANLISNDILSDIALLTVKNPTVLAMNFGSTLDLKVTDDVLAVGYAYNFKGEPSVAKGILSARRSAGGIEFLQTDISLNSGSSGGPLINQKGELLGINTYASENSTIGMSISTESLENIINKLTNNKSINYIENERPKNALGVIFKEIGYETDDIYNEKNLIKDDKVEKEESKKDNTNNNEEGIPHKILSNIKTLDSLNIEGYNIDFDRNVFNYSVNLKNNETSLEINAKTTDTKSTYVINGNTSLKKGVNSMEIIVTAEDKSVQKYTITAINPITKLDRVIGIILGLDIEYNSSLGANCFKLFWDYKDSDGVRVYPNTSSDLFGNITVEVYAGWSENDSSIDTNGKALRILKTYNFTPTSLSQTSVYIPISDIRESLNKEDYEGGIYAGADLTFKVKINTREQGTFYSRTPWGLSE